MKGEYLWIGLILIAIFASYSGTLSQGFVWDDELMILANQDLHSPSRWGNFILDFSRPFNGAGGFSSLFSSRIINDLYFDFTAWGFNASGYHLTNLLVHLANVYLVYLLAQKFFKTHTALITSFIFGIHPVRVESVAWISGRTDVFVTFFLLLSFLHYLKWRQENAGERSRNISITMFILALFTKEVAIAFVGVLCAYEFLLHTQKDRKLKPIGIYGACGILQLLFVYLFTNSETLGVVDVSVLSVLGKLIRYAGYVIVPYPLNIYPLFPAEFFTTWFGIAVLGLIVACIALLLFDIYRTKNKFLVFCVLFFILMLMPHLGIVGVTEVIAERYLYFSSLGLLFIIAHYLEKIPREVIAPLFIGMMIICGALTIDRIHDWQNSEILMATDLAAQPENYNLNHLLGSHYVMTGQFQWSIPLLRKAIDLRPQSESSRYNLVNAYRGLGDYDSALLLIKETEEVVERSPDLLLLHGNVLYESNNHEEALTNLEEGMQLIAASNIDTSAILEYSLAVKNINNLKRFK